MSAVRACVSHTYMNLRDTAVEAINDRIIDQGYTPAQVVPAVGHEDRGRPPCRRR